MQQFNTLSTKLYASQIDSTEAVQVHVFENAMPDFSDEILVTALEQADNDTLQAIALLMALVSDCEITSLSEIYDNGNRGMELELNYLTQSSNIPYTTVIRYFLINGNFVSFTWTGKEDNPAYIPGTTPHPTSQNKNIFFQSISMP